ncbi:MAG: CRISPR system precrRNA processing endoribonuclease RAMP protein Cas6 [Acidobacteriota bacterium]
MTETSQEVAQQVSASAEPPRPTTFELLAFRLEFIAQESVYFPPGKSGNIVRGAFGSIFRQLVCVPDCHNARECEKRPTCPYARIFEPVAQPADGPSGLHDWPRPFVFRAAHLDGMTIEPGKPFHFDVHIFDLKDPAIVYFVLAFAQVVKEGIGPRRGRARLVHADQLDANGGPAARVYNGQAFVPNELLPPVSLDLSASAETAAKIRVRFLTPTELKHGQLLATRPEFPVLLGRIRDRLSTLRALYGAGPLDIDFKAMGERAAAVKMTSCNLQFSEAERRSAKSGERHPLGGFVGEAEYEGELGEFLPYLRAAKWIGIGRQTVWGKGVIEVQIL